MSDAPMPGAWVCDFCEFQLQKSVLTPNGVFANDSPLNEKCPNDGRLMRPLTWREANESLFKRATELLAENTRMREALTKIRDFPVHSEPVGCVMEMQEIATEALK